MTGLRHFAPIAAAALFAAAAACAQDAPPTEDADSADAPAAEVPAAAPAAADLLTIITSADPETQFMALTLTRASVEQGKTARILLCSAAGDLALAEPPEAALTELAPPGMSPHALLSRLIDAGVEAEVCAIYLPNRDFGAEALIDGVGVAAPGPMAAVMAGETTKLFTF